MISIVGEGGGSKDENSASELQKAVLCGASAQLPRLLIAGILTLNWVLDAASARAHWMLRILENATRYFTSPFPMEKKFLMVAPAEVVEDMRLCKNKYK
ncbi:unnamed protein product [Gongylonema pulchrum]|uniref:CRAL-TRIO domain-containing protein n=1 Tax=Gongylonema pulchrum TaxID=637853 RepID=A0A183F0Y9_9BILA|nr:unnamed protein product [Gongylonema pulchrum]